MLTLSLKTIIAIAEHRACPLVLGGRTFDYYRLPDGCVVPVDASASKGADYITYTLKGGRIVVAMIV